jgi:hypothetical protein
MTLQWIGYLKQSSGMDLLKVGGAASVVNSVITLAWNGVRDARASRCEARHVNLTVSLSLEKYARDTRLMMHRADWARQEAARVQYYDPLKSIALLNFVFSEYR